MRVCKRLIVLVFACMLGASPALAQEEAEAPAMTPEQAAMMEAWTKAMTPGPEHARLAEAAGEWRARAEMWMDPDGEPEVGHYEVSRTMTMGGRVLEEEWKGTMMGQPFIGHGRTGYNNVTGKYWSTWTDNMSTGLMTFEGSHDDGTGKYSFTGSYADPMTGDTIQSRSVSWTDDSGREIMEMHETRDGREMMTMRLVLERNTD